MTALERKILALHRKTGRDFAGICPAMLRRVPPTEFGAMAALVVAALTILAWIGHGLWFFMH